MEIWETSVEVSVKSLLIAFSVGLKTQFRLICYLRQEEVFNFPLMTLNFYFKSLQKLKGIINNNLFYQSIFSILSVSCLKDFEG